MNCSARNALESGLISRREGSLKVFLELRRERGVYSRVTAAMAIQTHVCSVTSVLLSSYEGHLRNLLVAWQGNRDTSRREASDPVSLSSCRVIFVFFSFSRRVRHRLLLKHELRMPLEVSKGCEASCPDEAGT